MEKDNAAVQLRRDNDVLIAAVSGEIDHHSAAGIRRAIDSEISAETPDKLVMELSGVSFMDSSGLGLVLGRYAKAREAGIEFSVSGAGERIMKIFHMAGLERIITLEGGDKHGKS